MTAGLTWFVIAGLRPDAGEWTLGAYIIVGIFLLPVVLIPIQVVRYFREKRASR